MLIAQITDTHIQQPGVLAEGRVDTARLLQDCVAAVLALPTQPDLIVLTGDLVDRGSAEEYAQLRELLAPLKQRLLLIPGNHDSREGLRTAFPEHTYLPHEGWLQYVVEAGPLRIIGLDTLVPGRSRGELCAERLDWLDRTLAEAPGQPALIMMHHPPFLTGISAMDHIGLTGREAFAEIVAGHPQVALILCGHLHRNIQTTVGGHRTLTCPSSAHQIALDLRPGAPLGYNLEPAGYMLHQWTGEGFTSHVAVTGPYPGPYLY